MFVKESKCEFGQDKVEYLGHIISDRGVEADDRKIQAMRDWPRPKNVKSLRGFLGLTGYYRRFIKRYGILSKPLTQLLKKGQFLWNTAAEEAFLQLKQLMSNTPILAVLDFSRPLIIETDACKSGVGAVLMQDGKPIAYLSKALGEKHLGLSTYEKELLAVIIATQKWRSYLLGHHFIIKTDQEALKHLMEHKITTGLQQKWLSKLLGFNYTVLYKRGKENCAADALSRLHGDAELCFFTHYIKPQWRNELSDSLTGDSTAQQLIAELTISPTTIEGYSLSQGDLLKEGRLYVGQTTYLRSKICSTLHGSTEGGHLGTSATINVLKEPSTGQACKMRLLSSSRNVPLARKIR